MVNEEGTERLIMTLMRRLSDNNWNDADGRETYIEEREKEREIWGTRERDRESERDREKEREREG